MFLANYLNESCMWSAGLAVTLLAQLSRRPTLVRVGDSVEPLSRFIRAFFQRLPLFRTPIGQQPLPFDFKLLLCICQLRPLSRKSPASGWRIPPGGVFHTIGMWARSPWESGQIGSGIQPNAPDLLQIFYRVFAEPGITCSTAKRPSY